MAFYDSYFEINPDIYFLFNVLSIVFSLFLIYKSIKYFQLIRSTEYLIIAGIFLRYAYTNWVIVRVIYYENFTVHWINQADYYWQGFPWVMGFGIAVALGNMLILYHVSHILDFAEKRWLKITFGIVSVIAALWALFTIIWGLETAIAENWNAWNEIGVPKPYKWYHKFFFFHFLFSDENVSAQLPAILVNLTLIFAYVTIKPEINSKPIIISRILWISFGISNIINGVINIYVNQGSLADWDLERTFNSLNTAEFISVSAIIILLLLYPETLLVSRYQIINAHNLYKMVDKSSNVEITTGLPFISTSNSLQEYISNLPPELIFAPQD
ncbi:MAG: hypothetical protein GPJ54_15570 [Candidatus Heimdallarchaeota archaeon]|nr:hypothetical protein [Candidatus Heimdallarchaeota archaeon]